MADRWAEACGVVNTALATHAEVSRALQLCLDLQAAHVPCESLMQQKLSAGLRTIIEYGSDEWLRTQAGRVLKAPGPVTGATARAIQSGDARVFDDVDVRKVAISFATPAKPASLVASADQEKVHDVAISFATPAKPASLAASAGQGKMQLADSGGPEKVQRPEPTLKRKMVLEPDVGRMVLEPTMRSGCRRLCLDPAAGACLDAVESVDWTGG